MADTFTPNYNFTKPEVGGSRDSWGSKDNENWDKVDTKLKEIADSVPKTPATGASCCEVIWVNATTLRLRGKNGNYVNIAGAPRVIPAAGVDFITTTGNGVVANSNNYLVAAWDVTDAANPKIVLKAVQTSRTVHSTLGYATCGNDAETLVAGFYTQSDKSVLWRAADKHLATWYNPTEKMVVSDVYEGATASQTYIEINSAMRVSAFMWGDRTIHGQAFASCQETTFDNMFFAASMDGSQDGDRFHQNIGTIPQGYSFPAYPAGPMDPRTDGFHYVTGLARMANSTGYYHIMKTAARLTM